MRCTLLRVWDHQKVWFVHNPLQIGMQWFDMRDVDTGNPAVMPVTKRRNNAAHYRASVLMNNSCSIFCCNHGRTMLLLSRNHWSPDVVSNALWRLWRQRLWATTLSQSLPARIDMPYCISWRLHRRYMLSQSWTHTEYAQTSVCSGATRHQRQ